MIMAITIWGNRISPVFDAAKTLLIVKMEHGEFKERFITTVPVSHISWYQDLMQEHCIEVLICGAICEEGIRHFEVMGVKIMPFITGEVEALLDHLQEGWDISHFAMPGCQGGRCCRKAWAQLGYPWHSCKNRRGR